MDMLIERIGKYRNLVEPLVARTCSRVTIDMYAPPLVLWFLADGPAARVEINVPFRLRIGPDEWSLDPLGELGAVAPVLSLMGRTVIVALARDDGGLYLEFTDDAAIDVEQPEGDIEPWWFDIDGEAPTP